MLRIVRFSLAVALVAGLLSPATLAAAAPKDGPRPMAAEPTLLQRWLEPLRALLAGSPGEPAPRSLGAGQEAGPHGDPNGLAQDAGPDSDPNGLGQDAGPNSDPNG